MKTLKNILIAPLVLLSVAVKTTAEKLEQLDEWIERKSKGYTVTWIDAD